MTSFNVADGSIAAVDDTSDLNLTLIKASKDNTWYYAPRSPKIATDGTGRPLFSIVRYRNKDAAGNEITAGGAMAAQLELTVPLLNGDQQGKLTQLISSKTGIPSNGGSFKFQPLSLRDGKMNILGVDSLVVDPDRYRNKSVGASSTLPLSLELSGSESVNKLGGADIFRQAMKNSSSSVILPMVVELQYVYDMILPQLHYTFDANVQEFYKYFSENVKARASYWGWVGADYDRSKTREELISNQCIKIETIRRPEIPTEKIQELTNNLIDIFTKSVLTKMCKPPELDPAVAPNPRGYFGGVSVAIKEFSQVQDLKYFFELKEQLIVPVPYTMSYVFGPQFRQLDPQEYVLDVRTDNTLAVSFAFGQDTRVSRYIGQYGYIRADGSVDNRRTEPIAGKDGGVLLGTVQYGDGEPMPTQVKVAYIVDWTNPDWDDTTYEIDKEVTTRGVADEFSPGNFIPKITIRDFFSAFEAGTIINYNAETKWSNPTAKIYSVGSAVIGQGVLQGNQLEFEFPLPSESEQTTGKIVIEILVIKPNGQQLTKRLAFPVTQPSIVLAPAMIESNFVGLVGLMDSEYSELESFTSLSEWSKDYEKRATDLTSSNPVNAMYWKVKSEEAAIDN